MCLTGLLTVLAVRTGHRPLAASGVGAAAAIVLAVTGMALGV